MSSIKPKECICIDLGSGFIAIRIFNGRRFETVSCPVSGQEIPTVVYRDPKSETWYVGRKALMQSMNDKGDNLFQHAKRQLLENAEEKLYGGKYSAIDIFVEQLRYSFSLILSARPDFADHPAFGGTKRSPDELAVIFTVPCNWGMEQQTH